MEQSLRLFNAVLIPEHTRNPKGEIYPMDTIPYGFVISPEVTDKYGKADLIRKIRKHVGISGEEANATFHKSWKKVAEASIEQLVMEQIVHYITTYGFEELGIYDSDSVYIPCEKLEIPEIDLKGFRLTIIHGLTTKEMKSKLLDFLNSGIALKEDTVNDAVTLALSLDLTEFEMSATKNREVKTMWYEGSGVVPRDPVEFLRMAIYTCTDKTLIIKSKQAIEEIKAGNKVRVIKLFQRYNTQHGFDRLSQIFYRYKPLFLAFRHPDGLLRCYINEIRKKAVHNHKPLPEDCLGSVTSKLKRGDGLNIVELTRELEKATVFRKIRLAYALAFRTAPSQSILYKIRNGKGYATEFDFQFHKEAQKKLEIVLGSIARNMSKQVKGKKIYIPNFIDYALPATEKQYTGHFPSGTCVRVPHDMMVGVHWNNLTNRRRIDLDLALLSDAGKYGWDAEWRSEDRDILFSGDVTDAPARTNGASEFFYVKQQTQSAVLLTLNYYNYSADHPVPFKIIVGQEKAVSFSTGYIMDPNHMLAIAPVTMTRKQKILGLLVTTPEESRFYFSESDLGGRITSGNTPFAINTRRFLFDSYERPIDLRALLAEAGAEVSTVDEADINLSPEALERDTFLKLLR